MGRLASNQSSMIINRQVSRKNREEREDYQALLGRFLFFVAFHCFHRQSMIDDDSLQQNGNG